MFFNVIPKRKVEMKYWRDKKNEGRFHVEIRGKKVNCAQLQNAPILLQNASGITKRADFITKRGRYYKTRRLLQNDA